MIISGKNVVKSALENNVSIKKVYTKDDFYDKDINLLLENKKINKIILEKQELDRLSKTNNQGIVMEVEDFQYGDISKIYELDSAVVLILDHIEDPANLGAIIRSAEAFAIDAIILPKNRSVLVNDTVAKVSVGTIYNINVIQVTNLSHTISKLKENNFWIYGTDMDGEDVNNVSFSKKSAIVIGNEGSGMSRIIREKSDFIVSINMKGKVNSLNASVAAGIMIYNAKK